MAEKEKYDVVHVDIDKVVADENQPRKNFDIDLLRNLKDSIGRFGIKVPMIVEKVGEKFLLVDGERRLRAAKELKLKQVPVIIQAPKSPIERLVEQFHIQEQHESWTPTEKAVTVYRLGQELGVSTAQICQLLALPSRTAVRYLAFADIVDKKLYHKNDIGIEWATPIKGLKVTVRQIMERNGEVFSKDIETSHLNKFLENPDVELSPEWQTKFKEAGRAIRTLLGKVED